MIESWLCSINTWITLCQWNIREAKYSMEMTFEVGGIAHHQGKSEPFRGQGLEHSLSI